MYLCNADKLDKNAAGLRRKKTERQAATKRKRKKEAFLFLGKNSQRMKKSVSPYICDASQKI